MPNITAGDAGVGDLMEEALGNSPNEGYFSAKQLARDAGARPGDTAAEANAKISAAAAESGTTLGEFHPTILAERQRQESTKVELDTLLRRGLISEDEARMTWAARHESADYLAGVRSEVAKRVVTERAKPLDWNAVAEDRRIERQQLIEVLINDPTYQRLRSIEGMLAHLRREREGE